MKEMSMTEENTKYPLVRRLRTMAAIGWNPIGSEAADEIEALRSQVDALKEQVKSLTKDIQAADDLLSQGDSNGALVQVRVAASRTNKSYLDCVGRASAGDLLATLEEVKEFISNLPVQTIALDSGHQLVSDPVPIMRFTRKIDAAIASVKGNELAKR